MAAVCLVVICVLSISNVEAVTRNAATCSHSDVQTQVNAAQDGDIVSVPAGSCTWTTPVSWSNKNISVLGAGACGSPGCSTGTVISSTGGAIFSIINSSKSGFRISSLTIKGVSTGGKCIYIDSTASYTLVKGWRVDHIYFDFSTAGKSGSSLGAYPVYIVGIANYGLVDHITYKGGGYGHVILSSWGAPDGWPVKMPGGTGGGSWTLPLDLPINDNAVYVEDSTWLIAPGHYISAVNDMNVGSGRMVFRHNQVTNAYFQTHYIGNYNPARGGAAWVEVYNNTFHATDSNWYRAVDIKSGTGVVYNNGLLDSYGTIDMIYPRSCVEANTSTYGQCDGSHSWDGNTPEEHGWPCLDQIGRAPGATQWPQKSGYNSNTSGYTGQVLPQVSIPLYFWNNGRNAGCANGGICNPPLNAVVNPEWPNCTTTYHLKTTGDPQPHAGGVLDFVNNGFTPKPNYQAYTYPHPLQQKSEY
jgi:hypothetical protein